MTRLSFVLMACVGMCVSSIFAQEEAVNGGTVRGKIVDTSSTQNPIEGVQVIILAPDGTEYEATTDDKGEFVCTNVRAGRYLINLHKEGYGDRLGKPVTVVNGGVPYVRLKMTKKADNITFTQKFQELQKLMTSENMAQKPERALV